MTDSYATFAQINQSDCAFFAVAERRNARNTQDMERSDDAKPYHEWLKDELDKPGRSQSALARFMGLDSSAINRLVNGKREVRFREIERIGKYLHSTRTHEPGSEPPIPWSLEEYEQRGALTTVDFATPQDADANAKAFFTQTHWLVRRALEGALIDVVAEKLGDDPEAGNSVYLLCQDPVDAICALHLMGKISSGEKRTLRFYCIVGAAAEKAAEGEPFPEQSMDAKIALALLADFLGVTQEADPADVQLRYAQRAIHLVEKLRGRRADAD